MILAKQLVFLTVSKREIKQHLCALGYGKPRDLVAFSLNCCCCYYSITIKPVRAGPGQGAHQPDAVQKENKDMVPGTKHINT